MNNIKISMFWINCILIILITIIKIRNIKHDCTSMDWANQLVKSPRLHDLLQDSN